MAVVITGDIIGSSRLALEQRQQTLNQLIEKLFAALRNTLPQEPSLETEIIQGDSFQLYLSTNEEAVRAALLIRCFFLSQSKVSDTYRINCRLSIAVGNASFLYPNSLAKSGGPVFDYSGRGLKRISRTGSQLVFESSQLTWTKAISMGLALVDEITTRCTPLQSQALFLKLASPDRNQEWLAERAGIGRSAYSQRLKQAGWAALEIFLDYYTETVRNLLHDTY